MVDIERFSVRIASAAHVVGVSETDIRSWINREGMFSEKRRGQGVPFSFTVQDLFNLAAVRALISAGFTIRAACEAIRPYSVYGALLENHDFILSMSVAGRLIGIWGSGIPVTIHIDPKVLAEEMRPQLVEEFGEAAVAEWDEALQRLHND
ncbi:MAG: MerR family transcriptional regulator [Alphaproteobacteria bacterium]|nr:MerR family transcriptional regulator [Alphaproteobacteria bacterium]